MRLKKLTLGLVAALLLSAPLAVEAKVYEAEESMDFNTIDTQIGKTVDFVEMQNHYIVKRDLAYACAMDFVKPYFAKKGITLSKDEGMAVAFGAMQLENGKHTATGNDRYSYRAKGVIYYDWEMDSVYDNKKFMQAYMDNMKQVSVIYETYAPDWDFYFQNKNSSRITEKSLQPLKEQNVKLTTIYHTLENMELFWQHGAKFVLTGDYVNLRTAPSTNSEVLDLLRLNEELYPVTGEIFESEGRKWAQVISANGQEGFVSADYIQIAS